MPTKGSGQATTWETVDEWDAGRSWQAYPEETMERTSHAIADGDDVWLVDPIAIPDFESLLEPLGSVAGVVLLLDRHKRDAANVANNYDVPVHIPAWMDGVEQDLDAPVVNDRGTLGNSPFEVVELTNNAIWQEAALWNEETGTLVVPEAVGTVPFFRASGEELGVHPMLRLLPPTSLGDLAPERILVGHGSGVHTNAAALLDEAIAGSRTGAPSLYGQIFRAMLPV
jgi:hypothetical protein